jgi:hypothetical protein
MVPTLVLQPAVVPKQPPRPATLDIAGLLHPADWARLPESLRRRFAAGHGPARHSGTMSFERSAAGAAFAFLAQWFGAPLPMLRATDAPVTVDVRTVAGGISWSRRFGPSSVVQSVKSAGPAGTVIERVNGGLGMVLDVSVEDAALACDRPDRARSGRESPGQTYPESLRPGASQGEATLVFTSRSFFLTIGRWRMPIPGWLTPGRCRVEHRAIDATRFRFTLTMTHALWGTTFRQAGVFTTQESLP